MNFINRIFSRDPVRSDIRATRRVESERAKKAARARREREQAAIAAKAATLGKITKPMKSRERIAMEVQAERLARKIAADDAAMQQNIPDRGGSDSAGIGFLHPGNVEDWRVGTLTDANRATESLPAEQSNGRVIA